MSVLLTCSNGHTWEVARDNLNRLVALKMILAGAHASAQELARFVTAAEHERRIRLIALRGPVASAAPRNESAELLPGMVVPSS